MVYLAADNDLEAFAQPDINEMKSALPAIYNSAHIIVLKDLRGDRNTHLLKITSGAEEELSSSLLGVSSEFDCELDMSYSSTLDKFVTFCKTYFPSTYTALIIWNHGGGWRSTNSLAARSAKPRLSLSQVARNSTSRSVSTFSLTNIKPTSTNRAPFKDCCYDETSNIDYLPTHYLSSALASKNLTVIGFDACLMGMVEVAYELKDCASYMIASEETIPGNGWNYTTLLNNLNSYVSKTPLNFCQSAVNAYQTEYSGTSGATLSATDLSKVSALVTALNSFSTALASVVTNLTMAQTIHNILFIQTEGYYSIPGDNNIDIWHAADRIQASGYCTSQASALKTALTNAVVYEWHNSSGHPNSHGLSMYLLSINSSLQICHSAAYGDNYTGWDKIQFLSASSWGLGTSEVLYKIYYTY
jgi:hypothetical protein